MHLLVQSGRKWVRPPHVKDGVSGISKVERPVCVFCRIEKEWIHDDDDVSTMFLPCFSRASSR